MKGTINGKLIWTKIETPNFYQMSSCIPDSITFYEAYKIFNTDRKQYNWFAFDTKEGCIMFSNDHANSFDSVPIFYVKVKKSIRRQGLFTKFILLLCNDNMIRKILILDVFSKKMINCLKKVSLDGHSFFQHGSNFIYDKDLK